MKLAWFATSNEIAVLDPVDALRELAAGAERPGVAWWIGKRHEPTVDEGLHRLAFLRQHGVSPYAFTPAIAPHLAAGEAGQRIDLDVIGEAWRRLGTQADVIVIEGYDGPQP